MLRPKITGPCTVVALGPTLRLAAAILLTIAAAPAQNPARESAWRQDIQFLADELPRRHPNPFTIVRRDQFEQAVAELQDRVPSLTDQQIAVGLARITALIGDAHTSINPLQTPGFRTYPIRLRWFSDGLYAVEAGVPYARALGKKLIRVGDVPIDDVYAKVKEIISHENDWWVRALSPNYLISPEVLFAIGVLSESGNARFVFDGADAGELTVVLQPANLVLLPAPHKARPNTPLYRRNPGLFYWFDYLPAERTIYIQYNQCAESPALPMTDFARELIAFAESNPVDRFVFDLRNNTGGNSAILQILFRALEQSFVAGRIQPSKGAVAIIGKLTFSSGMLNAMDLKRSGALFVGEPSGGKPNSFGEVQAFVLPNSRITVAHSTRFFNQPNFPGDSLVPDLAVDLRGEDYFGEVDPFLETALKAGAQAP
jgi:hypothetical protein